LPVECTVLCMEATWKRHFCLGMWRSKYEKAHFCPQPSGGLSVILVFLGICNKIPSVGWFRQYILIPHSSGSWEVQDQRASPWWGPSASHQVLTCRESLLLLESHQAHHEGPSHPNYILDTAQSMACIFTNRCSIFCYFLVSKSVGYLAEGKNKV
jgi:hypothetical protein